MHVSRLESVYRAILALFCAALLALSLPLPSHAQSGDDAVPPQTAVQPVRFDHLTTEQGLSSNLAWGVVQDNHGFIWIGTVDGLNRYDGNTFKIYRYDPKDPNSLGDNSVRRLARDRAGNIWIGNWGGGLNKFDPITEQFTRYRHDPNDPQSLSGNQVFAIHEDPSGTLWVGTAAGLDRLERETNTFTHYRHDPDDPRGLSQEGVHAICAEQSGELWVGTNGGGLNRLDPDTGEFTHYRHDPAEPNSLVSDRVASIYQEPSGIVWIGTYDKGLSRFDPESGQFTNYVHDPADPNSLGADDIRAIVQDQEGELWFGGGIGGVFRLEGDMGKFVRYQHDNNDPGSLSHDGVVAISADLGGALWIATAGGGVNRLDPNRKPFALYQHNPTDPGSLSHSDVRSLYVDHTGTLWAGTVLGLNRYIVPAEPGPGSGQFTRFFHDRADPQGLNGAYVMCMVEDQEGSLWIGSLQEGLIRLDRDSENHIDASRFTQYQHDPNDPQSLQTHFVRDLYVDRSGKLWVGTLGGGLSWFDKETEKFHRYQRDPDNPKSLSDDSVVSILEDDSGRLWVATLNGLNRFDRETEEFVRYPHDPNDSDTLSHNNALELFKDREGVLWVGTNGGGLNRFDSQNERFIRYTKQDGLPSDMITGIIQDDAGFLWLSTSQGLSKFDPRSAIFRNYDVNDGLQGNQFNINAVARSSNGELFFGGVDGFNAFNPAAIKDSPIIPPVVITDLQLANRPVEIGGDSALQQSILATKELLLAHDDRVISFEFAALNFSSPEKNRYRYKLEGFDEDWTETGSDRRFVTYTNLDPGDYVFRVLGSNNDGVWNEEGAALKITVTPPWWGTWWFRGLVALLLVGLVAGGYTWRVRSIQARSHELEEEVATKTTSLQEEILERRETEQRLRRARDELSTLLAVSQDVVSTLDLDRLLELIMNQLGQVLDSDAVSIHLLVENKLELRAFRYNAAIGVEPPQHLLYEHMPVFREMMDSLEGFVLPDLQGEPALMSAIIEHSEKGFAVIPATVHSFMAAPLASRSVGIGMLSVSSVSPNIYDQESLTLLQAFANQAAIAIENAQLYARAQETATLEERTRLARDLHDSATQALYSALLFSETGKKLTAAGDPEGSQYYQERAGEVIQQALKEMRLLVYELRPPELEAEGLAGALQMRLDAVESRVGMEARLITDPLPTLPAKVVENLYRVALEALNNVLKHAQADSVTVILQAEGKDLFLEVADDGMGFDPDSVRDGGGMGLIGIQERIQALGGDLTIDSAPGEGTRIRVRMGTRESSHERMETEQ